MSGHVRCDRVARPAWRAIPEEERAAIEQLIPPQHVVTVNARTGVNDLTIRLFRDKGNPTGHAVHEQVAKVEHVRWRDLANDVRWIVGVAGVGG